MTEAPPSQGTSAADLALAFQLSTRTISGRLSAILALLWRQLDPGDPRGSWAVLSPTAEGAFVAAQLAAAGQGDAFVRAALAAQGVTVPVPRRPAGLQVPDRVLEAGSLVVDPVAFAGEAASGLALTDLLAIPAHRYATALAGGVSPRAARTAGGLSLGMYAETEIPDAARGAVQVSMAAHHVAGYIRHVGSKCCSRCAILSGRWYRFSRGFQRHPRCVCGMQPAPESEDAPDPMTLFREGRITDLTHAERAAIELGADLNQVVNAKRGLYVAGGQQFTSEGTTRRGVAGARMFSSAVAERSGSRQTVFTDYAVSRREVAAATAKYGPIMERGNPFTRAAPLGGTQTVPGRLRSTGRPSVAQIMRSAGSPDEIRRALLNYGYVTTRTSEIADVLRSAS